MLRGNYADPFLDDEQLIRAKIRKLMAQNTENRADDFHLNESFSQKQGRRVRRGRPNEPKVL